MKTYSDISKSLIDFERLVADKFEAGEIKGPIHLSGGNENELIKIFKDVRKDDWVFSTWRSHYHALLKGISPEWLMDEIIAGRSMSIMNPENKFFTSAIVGGILPIALGVAAAIKRKGYGERVWVFIGDMTSETGGFHEVEKYARGFDLPIIFVIENNEFSTDTPTQHAWGTQAMQFGRKIIRYSYERTYPHTGTGKWVSFV